MRAIVVYRRGGPEVLTPTEWPCPDPGTGEVLVDVMAIGVNYHDTYERTGLYPREVPYVPGREIAGIVTAVGEGVTGIGPGNAVATADVPRPGAYAERVVVRADRVVTIPRGVSIETAAAVLLQGLTVHYLTRASYPVRTGDTALVHAAAGGIGLLLTQMITMLGGRAIATVSSPEKEKAARAAGATDVIRYTEADVVTEVRRLTGGRGVDVVFDAVGRATFDGSLECLRRRGTLVLYGQSSGKVPPVDLSLHQFGSIVLTRPYLPDFVGTREELSSRATDLFGWLSEGRLKVHIGARYPLERASAAHRDLQARRSIGKLLLLP